MYSSKIQAGEKECGKKQVIQKGKRGERLAKENAQPIINPASVIYRLGMAWPTATSKRTSQYGKCESTKKWGISPLNHDHTGRAQIRNTQAAPFLWLTTCSIVFTNKLKEVRKNAAKRKWGRIKKENKRKYTSYISKYETKGSPWSGGINDAWMERVIGTLEDYSRIVDG